MKIAVCYKIVRDENELILRDDKSIDESGASYIISPYDCNAVSAAMNLARSVEGSDVIAVTVGGDRVENSKMKKGILSRGPSAMYALRDDSLDGAESFNTAIALKAVISMTGGADLIICGEGSGDLYNQQTGNMLGAMMSLPTVNGISAIEAAGDSIRVERIAADSIERLEIELPAVISVTSDICVPGIPSMKEIIAAGKKPCTIYTVEEINAEYIHGVKPISIKAPENTERKNVVIKGDGDEQIAEFYNNIRKAIS